LELEPALVVCVCKDKENVLQNAKEVLLEEDICHCWIGGSKVVHNLEAYFRREVNIDISERWRKERHTI